MSIWLWVLMSFINFIKLYYVFIVIICIIVIVVIVISIITYTLCNSSEILIPESHDGWMINYIFGGDLKAEKPLLLLKEKKMFSCQYMTILSCAICHNDIWNILDVVFPQKNEAVWDDKLTSATSNSSVLLLNSDKNILLMRKILALKLPRHARHCCFLILDPEDVCIFGDILSSINIEMYKKICRLHDSSDSIKYMHHLQEICRIPWNFGVYFINDLQEMQDKSKNREDFIVYEQDTKLVLCGWIFNSKLLYSFLVPSILIINQQLNNDDVTRPLGRPKLLNMYRLFKETFFDILPSKIKEKFGIYTNVERLETCSIASTDVVVQSLAWRKCLVDIHGKIYGKEILPDLSDFDFNSSIDNGLFPIIYHLCNVDVFVDSILPSFMINLAMMTQCLWYKSLLHIVPMLSLSEADVTNLVTGASSCLVNTQKNYHAILARQKQVITEQHAHHTNMINTLINMLQQSADSTMTIDLS